MEETTASLRKKGKLAWGYWSKHAVRGDQDHAKLVSMCGATPEKSYTETLRRVLCTDIQTLPMSGPPCCAQLIRLTASWCLFTCSSTVCAHYYIH